MGMLVSLSYRSEACLALCRQLGAECLGERFEIATISFIIPKQEVQGSAVASLCAVPQSQGIPPVQALKVNRKPLRSPDREGGPQRATGGATRCTQLNPDNV